MHYCNSYCYLDFDIGRLVVKGVADKYVKRGMFMINKNKKFMFMVVVCVGTVVIELFSCMTTFINDSSNRIAILNKLDETFMIIPKSGKRRFGDQHKHAHFVVYTLQKEKTQLWSPAYTCQQNGCGSNGNVILKFSEMENRVAPAPGPDTTQLFTITKHAPYTSMVHTLPMIQGNPSIHF
jgi:hypothetical protein